MDEAPSSFATDPQTHDISGSGYNGYVVLGSNPSYYAAATGAINHDPDEALTLSGDFNGQAFIANADDTLVYLPTLDAYSVEAWVQTASTGNMILHGANEGSSPNNFSVEINPQIGTLGLDGSGKISVSFGFYRDTSPFPTVGLVSDATVNDGKWHHIVATWSAPGDGVGIAASQFHIYIDGTLHDGSTFSYGSSSLVTPVTINASAGTSGSGFVISAGAGPLTLDEYAVYGYALSATQVAAHYTLGVAP